MQRPACLHRLSPSGLGDSQRATTPVEMEGTGLPGFDGTLLSEFRGCRPLLAVEVHGFVATES